MGNPHKGEVSFEAFGKTYIFKMGIYAQAVLERRTKTPIAKFFGRPAEEMGVDDVLAIFYAGLFRQHKLTEEQVADLIDEIGMRRVDEIMGEALAAARHAAPENAEAGSATSDPHMEATGAGTTTTS